MMKNLQDICKNMMNSSRAIFHYDDGENFSGRYTHTHSPSSISHNPTDDENNDPENMTYEELTELGDSVGDVGKGLSQERISRLRTHKYGTKTKSWYCLHMKKKFVADDSQCSICLMEYAKGDKITTLPCKHIYHKDCISQWLKQNKVCCICKAEVVFFFCYNMRVMMQSKQMEMDEAFAASLLYDDDQTVNRSVIADDQAVAREWQNMEVNRSTSTQQQSHVGSSSHDSSDDSTHSLPPDVNIDPDNMTYEELNQLGESIGAVNKGLSKRRIGQIPTHKFTSSSRTRNLVSEKTQCPICIIDFKEGDTLSTLPCAHIYHEECISLWLQRNKV
ncbi:unnamed protein product [Arabidopsis thaliana]|uniref:(thale cress) hypothetical protein n=1 Tax=Arabidopsis thaliana TaxID=3702 RepID=A0A7G2FFR5_ARATH|nr:unnamed protein product [Arabidopsis thaliana]